jgi:hypothetical protein
VEGADGPLFLSSRMEIFEDGESCPSIFGTFGPSIRQAAFFSLSSSDMKYELEIRIGKSLQRGVSIIHGPSLLYSTGY